MTLRFDEVTRRYGDVVALNRFTLDVGPGVTALVGPNGAGKSSFMRLATGHVRPTSGTVTAFGQTVWDNPNVTARVGYVPEQDALYNHRTGIGFVTDMARLGGMAPLEARERAEKELDRLGLDDARHRPIKTYSKGMRQRVKLAQALVHEPSLLLLDEPMLGCDPIARKHIQDRVLGIARGGASIVMSTHILPEVERMTRRIAIIVGGRLVARGDANAVRDALSDVPSRVRVRVRNVRAAAGTLSSWDEVEAVRVRSDGVDVETPSLRAFLERLHRDRPAAWGFAGHDVIDSDLESLVGYLSEGSA